MWTWCCTDEAFARANPFRVDTARLILASPDPDRDLEAFIGIMGQHRVARNLSTFPHPLPPDLARDRLMNAQWKGCPGFTLGIYLRDSGQFIGTIGMGGDPVNVGYALHPDHWGQGLMREALAAFLARCFDQFALDTISGRPFRRRSRIGPGAGGGGLRARGRGPRPVQGPA